MSDRTFNIRFLILLAFALFATLACWGNLQASPVSPAWSPLRSASLLQEKKQDQKPKQEQKQDEGEKDKKQPQKSADDKKPKKDPATKSQPSKSGKKKTESPKQEENNPNSKPETKVQDADPDKAAEKKDDVSSRRRSRSRSIRRKYNKENTASLGLFEPVIADALKATVSINAGSRRVAYGSIVDSSGLVLTKSSELREPLRCRLFDNRVVDAEILGIDPATDLALLKIEPQMLPTLRFDKSVTTPEVGSWLATVGIRTRPVAIGVVSVGERKIPAPRGFMGIRLGDAKKGGVELSEVEAGLPAALAGVQVGDVIIAIDGKETPSFLKLREAIGNRPPGAKVEVTLLRDGEKIERTVILANRDEQDLEESERSRMQNTMSGKISVRRKDFPLAFRHDSYLARSECGGPVVDIEGRVIGVNIARSGRVESLCLPNKIVAQVVEKLKTGKFLPAVVNKEKIEVLEKQLAAIKPVRNVEEKRQRLNTDFEREQAVEESLKKILTDLQKKLDAAQKAREDAEKKLKQLSTQHDNAVEQKEKLRQRIEELKKGLGGK